MAASSGGDFDAWLSEKLKNMNPDVDLEVFVSYLRGILETETDSDDKNESITGILAEITEEDLEKHCDEIVQKWEVLTNADSDSKTDEVSLEKKLAGIMEQQQHQVIQTKAVSSEQKARKAAILAQYAEVSDGEESDDDIPGEGDGATGINSASAAAAADIDLLLSKNVNAQLVIQREKDQRDKEKKEADVKKLRDKEEREKQKAKVQDRKDAEKKRTQKGERRR